MVRIVDKWKNNIEETIISELGPIPDFNYGSSRISSTWGTPWRVGYKNKKPVFWVYETQFDKWFFNDLNSEEHSLKEKGFGRLIFDLVHDITHLYQMEPMIKKDNPKTFWLFKAFKHFNWVEGLAQLYTFKICNDMYKESKNENFDLLKNQTVEEFVLSSLESKKYKRSIADSVAHFISIDTRSLRDINEIKKNEFSFSNYPFDIHKEIIEKVDEKILSKKDNKKEIKRKKVQKNPYLWGTYQLSKLISKGNYTMSELVQNPLSNKELKRML